MRIFVLFNTVQNYIALFWSYIRIRKIQTKRPKNGAPLAIRAWTLYYSLGKAPAEPGCRNNDNRPRLFFISPHIHQSV
jgi:hypothetical protein